jgi:hypothetical protein
MIRWPENPSLPATVWTNLERLRQSGAALELEADAETWTFENLPWWSDYPIRTTLRNSRREPIEILFDEEGLWRFVHPLEVPRVSAEFHQG